MLGCAGVGDDSDDDGDVIETIIEQQPSLMQVDPHDIEDAEVGGGPMPLRLRLRCALCTLPPLTSARCPLLPAAPRCTAPHHCTSLQDLLESYYIQIDAVLRRLLLVSERIDDTEVSGACLRLQCLQL